MESIPIEVNDPLYDIFRLNPVPTQIAKSGQLFKTLRDPGKNLFMNHFVFPFSSNTLEMILEKYDFYSKSSQTTKRFIARYIFNSFLAWIMYFESTLDPSHFYIVLSCLNHLFDLQSGNISYIITAISDAYYLVSKHCKNEFIVTIVAPLIHLSHFYPQILFPNDPNEIFVLREILSKLAQNQNLPENSHSLKLLFQRITSLIKEKPSFFISSNVDEIIRVISPLLKKLQFDAIVSFSNLFSFATPHFHLEIINQMTISFFSVIEQKCPIFQFPKSKISHFEESSYIDYVQIMDLGISELHSFSQGFDLDSIPSFPDSFEKLQFDNKLNSFLDPELKSTILYFVQALSSSQTYIDPFLSTFFENLRMKRESPYLPTFCIYATFIGLELFMNIDPVEWLPNTSLFLASSSIFNEISCLNCPQTEDYKLLNLLRDITIYLALKHPSEVLIAVISILKTYTPIFNETILRLTNFPEELQSQAQKTPFLKMVSELLTFYKSAEIYAFNKNLSENDISDIELARKSIITMLITLFKNDKIRIMYFNSLNFLKPWFNQTYEENLRPFLLEDYQTFLLNSNISADNKVLSLTTLYEIFTSNFPPNSDVKKSYVEDFLELINVTERFYNISPIKEVIKNINSDILTLIQNFDQCESSQKIFFSLIKCYRSAGATFSLSQELMTQFHLAIKKFFGTVPNKDLIILLLSFLNPNFTMQISDNFVVPNFEIKQSFMLPLIFQIMKDDPKFDEFIYFIIDLCKFSTVNILACHQTEIDLELIKKISEIKLLNKDTPEIRKSLSIYLHLFEDIAKVFSSATVVKQFISLLAPIDMHSISIFQPIIENTLNNLITDNYWKSGHSQKLGNSVLYEVFLPQITEFLLTFKIIIYKSANDESIPLFSLGKFNFFIKNFHLVFKIDSGKEVYIINFKYLIPANQIVYIFLSISDQTIVPYFNFKKEDLYDIPLTTTQAMTDNNFKLIIGGQVENLKSEIELTSFQLFPSLDEEKMNSLFISNERNDLLQETIQPIFQYLSQAHSCNQSNSSFAFSLLNLWKLDLIIPLFYTLDFTFYNTSEYWDDAITMAISILSKSILSSEDVQKNFYDSQHIKSISFILSQTKRQLSFINYLEFYSLFQNVTEKSLKNQIFESILVNPDIWNGSPASDYINIIQHWANILFLSYSPECKVVMSFKKFLSICAEYYLNEEGTEVQRDNEIQKEVQPTIKENLHMNSNEEEFNKTSYVKPRDPNFDLVKCKYYLIQILLILARISFAKDDYYAIVSYAINSKSDPFIQHMLGLLSELFQNNQLIFPNHNITFNSNDIALLHLLLGKSESIILNVLQLIVQIHQAEILPSNQLSSHIEIILNHISMKLLTHNFFQTIFYNMNNNCSEFLPLCIWYSLNKTESEQKEVLNAIQKFTLQQFSTIHFLNFWILLFFTYCEESLKKQVVTFMLTSDAISDYFSFFVMIGVFSSLNGFQYEHLQVIFLEKSLEFLVSKMTTNKVPLPFTRTLPVITMDTLVYIVGRFIIGYFPKSYGFDNAMENSFKDFHEFSNSINSQSFLSQPIHLSSNNRSRSYPSKESFNFIDINKNHVDLNITSPLYPQTSNQANQKQFISPFDDDEDDDSDIYLNENDNITDLLIIDLKSRGGKIDILSVFERINQVDHSLFSSKMFGLRFSEDGQWIDEKLATMFISLCVSQENYDFTNNIWVIFFLIFFLYKVKPSIADGFYSRLIEMETFQPMRKYFPLLELRLENSKPSISTADWSLYWEEILKLAHIQSFSTEVEEVFKKWQVFLDERQISLNKYRPKNIFNIKELCKKIITERNKYKKIWNRLWNALSIKKGPWKSIQVEENIHEHKTSPKRKNQIGFAYCPFMFEDNNQNGFTQDPIISSSEQLLFNQANSKTNEFIIIEKIHLITINRILKGNMKVSKDEIFLVFPKISKIITIQLKDIQIMIPQSIAQCLNSIEIFTFSGKSYFIKIIRDINNINSLVKGIIQKIISLCKDTIQASFVIPYCNYFDSLPLKNDWINGNLSNFLYLMNLNIFSGRTFNNISQYPIFPWILKDYSSESLDLNSESVFRSLGTPIGALDENRLKYLQTQYSKMQSENFHPFLYSSSPMPPLAVCSYLFRIEPFSLMFQHMSEQFNVPKDFINSIESLYKLSSNEPNFFWELTPEFFYMPEFCSNNKTGINEIKLPPWAKSPIHFIYLHRKALESDYVSEHLNEWIDLIWGVKQRSYEASNVYSHILYEDIWEVIRSEMNDLNGSEKNDMIKAISKNVRILGPIPAQLFNYPHPRKHIHPKSTKQTNDIFKFQLERELFLSSTSILSDNKLVITFITINGQICQASIDISSKLLQLSEDGKQIPDEIIENTFDPNRNKSDYIYSIIPSISLFKKQMYFTFCSIHDDQFYIMSFEKRDVIPIKTSFHSIKEFALDENYFAVTGDDYTTQIYHISNLQIPMHTIRIYSDFITTIAISNRFKILLIGTNGGDIIVTNLISGKSIRVIELAKEIKDEKSDEQLSISISKMIITPSWGFIVASAIVHHTYSIENYIFTYTINGILINKVKIFNDISKIISWSSKQNFDYLAFITTKGQLYSCEAFYLKTKRQNGTYQIPIIEMAFNPKYNKLVIIDSNGNIFVTNISYNELYVDN